LAQKIDKNKEIKKFCKRADKPVKTGKKEQNGSYESVTG
jgi:hypothetical protein